MWHTLRVVCRIGRTLPGDYLDVEAEGAVGTFAGCGGVEREEYVEMDDDWRRKIMG